MSEHYHIPFSIGERFVRVPEFVGDDNMQVGHVVEVLGRITWNGTQWKAFEDEGTGAGWSECGIGPRVEEALFAHFGMPPHHSRQSYLESMKLDILRASPEELLQLAQDRSAQEPS